jgi:ankyrin repeat protein
LAGKAAIHHAAEQGRSQVLEVLIESGAKINHDTREYYTPLHLAALNGHAFCCRVLINGGAFIDAQGGHQNSTPLHLAADGGHAQAARILIEEVRVGRSKNCTCSREEMFTLRMAIRGPMCVTILNRFVPGGGPDAA